MTNPGITFKDLSVDQWRELNFNKHVTTVTYENVVYKLSLPKRIGLGDCYSMDDVIVEKITQDED